MVTEDKEKKGGGVKKRTTYQEEEEAAAAWRCRPMASAVPCERHATTTRKESLETCPS